MNSTPSRDAQPRAGNGHPVGAVGPADFDHLDKLRECVNRGLCLIPEYGVIFDHPDAGTVRCACGRSDCTGKHPRIRWKGVTAPPTFSEVEYWYRTTPPIPLMTNWAVLLGASDPPLVALDVDTRNGGLKSFAALVAEYGPLPPTWQDESSRGGGHYYFVAPPGLPDKAHVVLGPGLDFLGGRHLVVIDPSVHWSGSRYQWLVPPWGATPVAELPPFLCKLAGGDAAPKRKPSSVVVPSVRLSGTRARQTAVPPADPIPADEAEVVRQALACVPEWPLSIQGQNGSGACFWAACRITQDFGLRGAAAWEVMAAYNRQRCQPIWSDAELAHKLDNAAKGPVTGRLRGTDWVTVNAEVGRYELADYAHLIADIGDESAALAAPNADLDSLDGDDPGDGRNSGDGGAPVPPAPDHPLTDPSGAGRAIHNATHPDPEIVTKADTWAGAFAAGPGVYLDRDPPADPAAVVRETLARARVVRSLTVLQSGRDCADAAGTISPGGPAAVPYPTRTLETCKNLAEVHRAEALGLAPTASVCPGCPHNTDLLRKAGMTAAEYEDAMAALPGLMAPHPDDDWEFLPWAKPPVPSVPPPPAPRSPRPGDDVLVPQCPHLAARDAANAAPHRVATSARAALDLANFVADADVVFLLDNAEDVLAPHAVTAAVRASHLDRLATAVADAKRRTRRGTPTGWWDALRAVIDAIRGALAGGVRATLSLPPAAPPPRLWSAPLWNALRNTAGPLPDQLIRVCAAAASGELRSLLFTPDGTAGPIAGGPAGYLSATWFPRVPSDATVIALADAPAGHLGHSIGRTVTDVTRAGPPGWVAHAVQCPARVTGLSRERGIAARIRGHLAAYPGERLAVLLPGNRKRLAALRVELEDLLTPPERERVAFAGWYEKGVPGCDRVLALGVPAIPSLSVERRLEQRDQIAAVVAGGDWGEVSWAGAWADGRERPPVACRSYRHPDWAAAYRDAVLDLLRRKLVGVSVPISILSDSDTITGLGLPLADEPRPIDGDELGLLEALRAGMRADDVSVSLKTGRRIQKSKKRLRATLSVSTPRLAELAGKPVSTVRRLMAGLVEAGLASRVGKRGGWTWPGPVVYPNDGSGEPGETADAGDAATTATSGNFDSPTRVVPESAVAASDPRPADGTESRPESDSAGSEVATDASWDADLLPLVTWFLAAEPRLAQGTERSARPDGPRSVTPAAPSVLYFRLRAGIEAGPGAARSSGLARDLREFYHAFGPASLSVCGPSDGVAA